MVSVMMSGSEEGWMDDDWDWTGTGIPRREENEEAAVVVDYALQSVPSLCSSFSLCGCVTVCVTTGDDHVDL